MPGRCMGCELPPTVRSSGSPASRPTASPCGQVRVIAVETGRADVEPIGWQPADIAYRAVISWVPLPTATVTFDPVEAQPAAGTYEQVRKKLASNGPGGFPIAVCAVRRVLARLRAALALRVRFEDNQPGGPCVRVLRADGSPAIPTAASAVACGDPAHAAATVVEQMEHVARWEQLRDLGSHRSALADAVQLKIYPAGPGEMALPPDRQTYGLAGEYTIPYGTNGEAPNVFMHLKNTSDRDLHVALLDLTDRLECYVLYQTKMLAAGTEDNVNEKGGPMKLSLSAGVDPVPGTHTGLAEDRRERESVRSRRLRACGSRRAGEIDRDAAANMLELIAARTVNRGVTAVDPSQLAPAGADWCATTVALVVEVPAVV